MKRSMLKKVLSATITASVLLGCMCTVMADEKDELSDLACV